MIVALGALIEGQVPETETLWAPSALMTLLRHCRQDR